MSLAYWEELLNHRRFRQFVYEIIKKWWTLVSKDIIQLCLSQAWVKSPVCGPKNSMNQWEFRLSDSSAWRIPGWLIVLCHLPIQKLSSWWLQPIWKILVKMGIFPKFSGWKKQNIWNHHRSCCACATRNMCNGQWSYYLWTNLCTETAKSHRSGHLQGWRASNEALCL